MRISTLIISIFCLLGGMGFCMSPLSSEAGQSRTVVINDNDWPPYFFGGSPQMPQGFAKELLRHLLPETGYHGDFRFYPVRRMHSYLDKGKLDVAVLSYKKERESFLFYGKEPLFTAGYRPVVRAGSNINIRSLEDFDNLRIGHLAGLEYSSSFLAYIEKRGQQGTLITATSGDSCIKMLLANIIDVFVTTSDTVAWRAKQMGKRDQIKILDFDIQTKNYFVTVSKKSKNISHPQKFLQRLDQGIRAAKEQGTFMEIAKKYGIR